MRDTLTRGADDEGERAKDHRRVVGVHAEPPAPRAAADGQGDRRRRAGGEAALRRRRGRLHRRPRLHAALRLPVAFGEDARRSAARRSGRGDRPVLRRLRQLRRGGRRRRALPVLLPRRRDPQSEPAGTGVLGAHARRRYRLAAAAPRGDGGLDSSAPRPPERMLAPAPVRSHHQARHPGGRRAGRRRRHRLDRRPRRAERLVRAVDLGAGRGAAHRRHDLLHRDGAARAPARRSCR